MIRLKLAAAALACGIAAVVSQSVPADARIRCDGNFQIVRGQPVSTLYCQEQELARVARTFGWRISVSEIRYSESRKAEVCRAVGFDNRVQQICAPYQPFGGDGRFTR